MLKTARFRSLARHPKSFTCIKFHSVRMDENMTREKKNSGALGKKTGSFFLSIGNNVKPPTCARVRPPLRCIAYPKESECVCNLIVLCVKQITLCT